jgi:CelD/BcsL family acetyltransferase involved in cellulose biosynthesis
MSVEWITSDEAFAALPDDEWDALVERLERPTPFLLHGWLTAWRRHFGREARLAVGVLRSGDALVGALPLQVRRRGPVRVAEWVGGEHAQLAAPLGEGDSLLEAVRDADLIRLAGLPAEDPRGTVERVEAPVVDLSDGWEETYRRRLSSKRRSQHRKRLKDLDAAGELRIRVVREGPELAGALEEALRLHALRWAGRRDGSTYGLAGGAEFHRDALGVLAARARIALLELDGTAIAFRYGLCVGGALVGNGIGFDPAFSRYSPGWVLMLAALEDAAAEGVRRVELLGGDESYKLQLADPAPLSEGLIGLTPLGRTAAVAANNAVRLRRAAKRSRLLRRAYALRPRRAATADS